MRFPDFLFIIIVTYRFLFCFRTDMNTFSGGSGDISTMISCWQDLSNQTTKGPSKNVVQFVLYPIYLS